MALWDNLTRFLAIEPMQERSIDSFVDHPGLTEQLAAIQGLNPRPWRVAGPREALGVPAIFGAVNLIANTVGSMSMKAFRDQVELSPDKRPRVVVRPDPFRTPREFYRQTAWNIATRGEAWWWIAARDIDGMALSILNVDPAEITVTEDPQDLRYPIIEWRGKRMRTDDMRQLVYAQEAGSLRGVGPLQLCGAAISVAVEAQEWAANFYATGGHPSLWIKTALELDEDEAAAFKAQWIDADSNTPRVTGGDSVEDIKEFGQNGDGSQMLGSRQYQNVEIATMFGMNATLLNAAVAGSSLTYQNVGSKFEEFIRECLRPNYLESMEQTMSDLVPRSTTVRFNTDALTLADPKTRYEVYAIGITNGIIDAPEARSFEGLAPGDVENASVPYSPPQAIPASLPIQLRAEPQDIRCDGRTTRWQHGVSRAQTCNKLLSRTGTFIGSCPRCKKVYEPTAA